MKKIFFIIPIFLIGCAPAVPSPEMIQTAIAETQAAFTPTQLASTVTATFAPSKTPKPSMTDTATTTPTLEIFSTATATSDPDLYLLSAKEMVGNVTDVPNRELLTYPEKFGGQFIRVKSLRVFNVIDNKSFQAYLPGTRDAIYVKTLFPFDNIYENTIVTVYGMSLGEKCFKNMMNATICNPWISLAAVELPGTLKTLAVKLTNSAAKDILIPSTETITPSQTSASTPISKEIQGKGENSSDLFSLPEGLYKVTFSTEGDYGFMFYIKDGSSKYSELISADPGQKTGQAIVELPASEKFYLQMEISDGDWSVSFEQQ